MTTEHTCRCIWCDREFTSDWRYDAQCPECRWERSAGWRARYREQTGHEYGDD